MENLVEYHSQLNTDHSEDTTVINIVNDNLETTEDSMKILEEGPFQEFLTLQPPPPSDMETMPVIHVPPVNQDFSSSNDVAYDFFIQDQDTEADAENQNTVVLTNLVWPTPTVANDNQLIIITGIPSVDNPLSTEENLQRAILEVNTTMNQEIGGSVPLVAQSTSNQQVLENVSGVVQNTTNHQVMKNISLVAQSTKNRQVIENATCVQNKHSQDENMASTSKPSRPTPKKRGRKPKSPEGRGPRPKKIKLYEMSAFDDADKERRRLNAINARKHRALAKKKLEHMENILQKVREERDRLRKEVEKYKTREEALLKQLGDYKIVIVK